MILLTLPFARAQEYKPFNLDSGLWCCMYNMKGGMFGGGTPVNIYATDSVKFYCSGDTLINSVAFKKLMYVGNTRSMVVPPTAISGYYGAVRNDVPNKKVYFVSKGYDSSYTGMGELLYDFDITIGDSIHTDWFFVQKEPVVQIDSVQYCNEYHKKYITSSGYSIIEGIGSENGLIPINFGTSLGWTFGYQEYGNSTCIECDFVASIDSYSIDQLNVFPNPTNGKVKIVSDLNIRYIELYDIDGTLIESLNYDDEFIELKNKGYYLLKIHTDSEIIIRKLIKE